MEKTQTLSAKFERKKPKTEEEENQIDPLMHKTELGDVILKYRIPILVGIAVLVLGAVAIAVYQDGQAKQREATSSAYFNYMTPVMDERDTLGEKLNAWQNEKDNKKKEELAGEAKTLATAIVTKLKALPSEYYALSLSYLDFLEVISFLEAEETLGLISSEEILALLTPFKPTLAKTELGFFLDMKLAGIHEDLGQFQEAITIKEGLIKSNQKILEAENYLDLARLYEQTGNMEQARRNYQYVVDTYSEEPQLAEVVKFAKIKLQLAK